MHLRPISAFSDNYIWMMDDGHQAVVVDPGDAAPVQAVLQELGLVLQSIVVTHHHADHTGGVSALKSHFGATVYGPAGEVIADVDVHLRGGDTFSLLGHTSQVIAVPGHTAGHIAYYLPEVALDDGAAPVLFCGDTLFSAGCGRLFEGTPAQMLNALDALAALPHATRVYAAHEYTLSNMRFAAVVEPDNRDLQAALRQAQQLRAQGAPTLPSSLDLELAINPFLRSRLPNVRKAIQAHADQSCDLDEQWFAALREWKDHF
ncbi:hydroxyacylglutathione hydrolase [Lampropedia puyangensis]|uniref:Hydroxyacylglutathione hydrolase n=1 Tax=Lampropedia puyangensis TaxID=1330072 RepID=A0A4V4GRL0_9BURK|nr:hydroxyacylglutathione hydrolase [Lampropedia puyangensis]THU00986.1 hydroxyacylglutathione hydrolase [Lampropedia puyangensis]